MIAPTPARGVCRVAGSRSGRASSRTARAASTDSSMRAPSRSALPSRVRRILRSSPRTLPIWTCSTSTVSGSHPARAGPWRGHLEVQRLWGAHDIEDPAGHEILDTVLDRRQIRCAVTVSAIRLTDDQRHRLALAPGEVRQEHAEGAVGDRRDPLGFQLLADSGERIVVGRFTGQIPRRSK